MHSAITYLQTGRMFSCGPARTVLLRVGIGGIMLWQLFGAAVLTAPTGDNSVAWLSIIFGMILSVLLIAGLLLPLTLLTTIVFWASPVATNLGFWSLGVEASTWALFALLIAGGRPAALERGVAQSIRPLAKLLSILYRIWGPGSSLRDFVARWVSLWFFSLTALYSVSLHRQDPFWLDGSLGSYLLTSTYLSRFHGFWDELLQQQIWVSIGLSQLVAAFLYVFGMIWLLIFFRGKVAAFVVRASTLGFFSFSACFLQIGVLPFVEMLLWIFWFLPGKRREKNSPRGFRFAVFYDDYCGLCQGTRRFLGRLDSTDVLLWIPASHVRDQLEPLHLTYEEVTTNLTAVRSDGKVISGFQFYLNVVWWIPTLIFFGPVLLIGKITRVGPATYRFIRDRRQRKDLICQLTPQVDVVQALGNYHAAVDVASPFRLQSRAETSLRASAFWFFSLGLGIVYGMSSPALSQEITVVMKSLKPPIVESLHYSLGLQPIDVFNTTDLRMTEHWVTFFASDGQRTEVIPITLEDGSRGRIQAIDSLVYGGTLVFHRGSIDQEPTAVCDQALTLTENPRVKRALDLLTPNWATFRWGEVMQQPLSDPTKGRLPTVRLCRVPVG